MKLNTVLFGVALVAAAPGLAQEQRGGGHVHYAAPQAPRDIALTASIISWLH